MTPPQKKKKKKKKKQKKKKKKKQNKKKTSLRMDMAIAKKEFHPFLSYKLGAPASIMHYSIIVNFDQHCSSHGGGRGLATVIENWSKSEIRAAI